MKDNNIFISGEKIADKEEKVIRGIFYGEGIFETIRWKNVAPVFLDRHIKRILCGASALEMPEPDGEKIISEIKDAVKISGFANCAVKICLVSGGPASPFFEKSESFQTVISVRKMTGDSPEKNIKLTCEKNSYLRGKSPLSKIKSLNCLENIVAMRDAKKRGFDDALLLSSEGFAAETTRCNIFWGKNRSISTPSLKCGILPGITRGVLMEVAHKNGFSVLEECNSPEAIERADFVFVTNSLIGMSPVEKLQLQDLTFNFSSSNNESFITLKNLLYQSLMWKKSRPDL